MPALTRSQPLVYHIWYHITIHHLVAVCRDVSSKYTHNKVRKSLPKDFSYIIQELLHEHPPFTQMDDVQRHHRHDHQYRPRKDAFIIAIANVIQRLAIDQLHILGDIYDRGPGAHKIMDMLQNYHHWDITWGNHDMLWIDATPPAMMPASVASSASRCATPISRRSRKGYGINMVPLATFAMDAYADDPCTVPPPILSGEAENLNEKTIRLGTDA